MTDKCDSHERMTQDCSIAKAATERHEEAMGKLFDALRIVGLDVQSVKSSQIHTQELIAQSMLNVERYHKEACDFQKSAEVIFTEFRDFSWFRRAVNNKRVQVGIIVFITLVSLKVFDGQVFTTVVKWVLGK